MGLKKWLKGSRLVEMVEEAKVVRKVDRAKQWNEREKELKKEAAPLVEELGITLEEAMLYVQAKRRKERALKKMEQMKKGLSNLQSFCDSRVTSDGKIVPKKKQSPHKKRKPYIPLTPYNFIVVYQMKKAVQITITEEQYNWLEKQPRTFNLSEKVRALLEGLMNGR